MTRNELFGVYDHKAAEKLAGMSGCRSPAAAKALLEKFEAYGAAHHAVYSFLHAKEIMGSSCLPTSKAQSDEMFLQAEEDLGKPEWESKRQKSGVMYQSLPAAGSSYHKLLPDPDWTMWSRMDFGRAHSQGIVDNLFREFLLSLTPLAKRKALSSMFETIRHPRGSSKPYQFIGVDGNFKKTGEQLKKKMIFRSLFMGLSLKSLFDDGTEKSKEVMQVQHVLHILYFCHKLCKNTLYAQFIRTWRLYTALTTPTKAGFGKDTFQQATIAGQSLCAQYEMLTLKYNRKFLKKCCVSYIKMLLAPSAIMKFGYVWEVIIDAKMKTIWGVVSKKGGAGGSAEEWAVTGYLRSLALLPILQATRLTNLRKTIFVKFTIADEIQFHTVPHSRACATYKSVLMAMFARSFGTAVEAAVQCAGYNFPGVTFRAVPFSSLQFFEKLKLSSAAQARYFNTYGFDWRQSGKSARNISCQPRLGSDCNIKKHGETEYQLIRVAVSVFNVYTMNLIIFKYSNYF